MSAFSNYLLSPLLYLLPPSSFAPLGRRANFLCHSHRDSRKTLGEAAPVETPPPLFPVPGFYSAFGLITLRFCSTMGALFADEGG